MALILRIILVLTIAAGGFGIYQGLERKKQREKLEMDLKAKTDEATKLTGDLAQTQKGKETAEATVKEKSKLLDDANSEIERNKAAIKMQQEKTKEVEDKLTQVTKDLNERKEDMEKILKALPAGMTAEQVGPKIKELMEQMTTLDQEKKVLDEQLVKLKAENKKLEEQKRLREAGKMPEGLTGHILSINDEWNFVVLDIGSNQGVIPDGMMMVHRDGALVGKVKVTSVEPSIAIADILPEWKQSPLQEGDTVTY